jgi:chloramphenicol 3-O phosphotransferase
MERGRVVVLNGGSSSGKTAIARRLQAGLDGTWLVLGVDLFLWTLPSRLFADPAGFDVADGVITRGEEFMRLYGAFQSATATLADSGVDILIDEVLLDGARDQRSWMAALTDLDVCWIAVRCDADLAETRAAQRGDRIAVRYDFEVDTGALDAEQSARVVADHLRARWPSLGASTSDVAFTYPLTSAWTARGPIRPAPWERRPTPEVE